MNRMMMCVIAIALAACGNKKEADKQPDKGSAAPTMGSAAPTMGSAAPTMGSATPTMGSAAPPVATAAVDVPTEEDFEGQAKTDITTTTVDAKVKAIEDQLGPQ